MLSVYLILNSGFRMTVTQFPAVTIYRLNKASILQFFLYLTFDIRCSGFDFIRQFI